MLKSWSRVLCRFIVPVCAVFNEFVTFTADLKESFPVDTGNVPLIPNRTHHMFQPKMKAAGVFEMSETIYGTIGVGSSQ